MSLQPDDVILNNKYRVLHLIGEGGMARVWLAEELTFGRRQVALKEPRADLPSSLAQEVKDRYQREVQVCAALEQAGVPNIVRALTAEPYEDGLLLVMEYMPGGDLAALLKEHPYGLPLEQAVGITLDLLRALAGVHGHELEIVHRDIKPSNVLFNGEGHAHLADFGLAQIAGVSGRSQLQGGQHPGTPIYMAPEQEASSRMLAPAADLFALGCVLFEMLTGQRYKRQVPSTRPSRLRPDVPRWLDEGVVRALAQDPWERWQRAGEMAQALEDGWAREQAWQAAQAQREAKREARRRRLAAVTTRSPRLVLPVLAVLMVVALGLGLVAALGGDAQATPTAKPVRTEVVVEVKPSTAHPTDTQAPPATPTRMPSGTPAASATRTSQPSSTPRPTATPTPRPTRTLVPTATRTPSKTPRPVPSPVPSPATTEPRLSLSIKREGGCLVATDRSGATIDSFCAASSWVGRISHWEPSPDSSRAVFMIYQGYGVAGNRWSLGDVGIFVPTRADWYPVSDITTGAYGPEFVWSPDGNRVAYHSHHEGNPELYVADLASHRVKRVTNQPGEDYDVVWLGSSRFEYCQESSGVFQTMAVNWDGTGREKVHDGCQTPR